MSSATRLWQDAGDESADEDECGADEDEFERTRDGHAFGSLRVTT